MDSITQTRVPRHGSLVRSNHCIISSTLKRSTIWTRYSNQRVVVVKNYILTANTVTNIKLMLLPLSNAEPEEKGDETKKYEPNSFSIQEMLESLASSENIITNGTTFNLQRKVFHPKGNNWDCALIVKGPDGKELELRRDTIDQDTFVRAARLDDIIAPANTPITKKTFKSTQENSYSIIIESAGKLYNSRKHIDFNHIFFCSEPGNTIDINNVSSTIVSKLCDEVPSDDTLANAYLIVS
jgi:hypothetical protein